MVEEITLHTSQYLPTIGILDIAAVDPTGFYYPDVR